LLGPLQMFHIRTGDFRTARYYAKRCSAVAGTVEDPVAIVWPILYWGSRST
jgi:hypothetical protein